MRTSEVLYATRQSSAAALDAGAHAQVAPGKPFGDDMAGGGYFLSDAHHRFLAVAIRRHLASKRGFVLVTGAPGADAELLARHLDDRSGGGCRSTLVRCRFGISFADMLRDIGRQLGLAPGDESDDLWTLLTHMMQEARKGVLRVLVIEGADVLDSSVFDELYRFTRLDDPHVTPVVLLTEPSFVGKLDSPLLDSLRPALVGRLSAQHLERDEVGAFIDHQLHAFPGVRAKLFPAETVEAIATAANGNPAIVNRMARLVLSEAGGDIYKDMKPGRADGGSMNREVPSNYEDVLAEEASPGDEDPLDDGMALQKPEDIEQPQAIEQQQTTEQSSVTKQQRSVERSYSIERLSAYKRAINRGATSLDGKADQEKSHPTTEATVSIPGKPKPTWRARALTTGICLSATVLLGASALFGLRIAHELSPPAGAEAPVASSHSYSHAGQSGASAKADALAVSDAAGPKRTPAASAPVVPPHSEPRPSLPPGDVAPAAGSVAVATGAVPRSTKAAPAASASRSAIVIPRAYRLQVGAVRSLETAKQEGERIKRQNGDLLGALDFTFQRADLGDRGIFYRIQIGPVAEMAIAERTCSELKRRGAACIVVKP